MCGIIGVISKHTDLTPLIHRMSNQISHRGPDGEGFWIDNEHGVAFGHRRLAIIDLSETGHQPMISANGRYVIVFNGEIYNFQSIRQQFSDYPYKGSSDTEVILAAISTVGVEKAVSLLIGMFAFALWDKQEKTLYLGRDRIGEKPLYYGWQNNTFLFGSELKALVAHPSFKLEINREALSLFLKYSYVPSPLSIYQGIHKLKQGHLLILSAEDIRQNTLPEPKPYWCLEDVIQENRQMQWTNDLEAIEHLEQLLKGAIRDQMIADVPLGAFLSGGIDSSTVVALMQAQTSTPVKTFTIGFEEATYNEANDAKRVAQHLNTDHTELYVSSQDALNVIPKLPTIYDEPFADASQVPTYLVAQLARQHVTVSLSGDAGDEVFGGYNRYLHGERVLRYNQKLPKFLRQGLVRGIHSFQPETWNRLYKLFDPFLPKHLKFSGGGDRLYKLASMFNIETASELYDKFTTTWEAHENVLLSNTPLNPLGNKQQKHLNFVEQMMLNDTLTYLPDDILAKVDRAAMAVSLETRVPFLDHRVIEFAWQLPLSMKIRDGQGKWILRQILYKYVPKELIERPKMGFGIPIEFWLRKELRDWCEHLLDETRLRQEGFFNVEVIQKKWKEHLSGQHNWQYQLWTVLMFQAWLEEQHKEYAIG